MTTYPITGRCACGTITYEVLAPFLCTNCCHCTWCQRETGTAFVLNSIIESSNFRITSPAQPVTSDLPSHSGDGQMIARCPKCYVAVYSDYGGDGTWVKFVRAGTLDDEARKVVKPTAHLFTSTKLDFVDLTSERERGAPVFEQNYRFAEVWEKDKVERYRLLEQKIKQAEKGGEAGVGK